MLDLHKWLTRMAEGDFSLPLAHGRSCVDAGVPDDHCIDSDTGPRAPLLDSAGFCDPFPVFEARPTINTAAPWVSSPHVGHLNISSNEWGVPMASSEVSVNGRNLSFDDVVYGYDILWYERRLFLAGSYQGVSLQRNPSRDCGRVLGRTGLIWLGASQSGGWGGPFT